MALPKPAIGPRILLLIGVGGCHSGGPPLKGPDVSPTQVSLARTQVCILDSVGVVQCYGHSGCSAPPTGGPYTDITSEEDYTCALRQDGEVDCWNNLLQFSGGLGGDLLPMRVDFLLQDRTSRQIGDLTDIELGQSVLESEQVPLLCGIDSDQLAECSLETLSPFEGSPVYDFMPFLVTPVAGISASTLEVVAISGDDGAIVSANCEVPDRSEYSTTSCWRYESQEIPDSQGALQVNSSEGRTCIVASDRAVLCEVGGLTEKVERVDQSRNFEVCGLNHEGYVSCSGPIYSHSTVSDGAELDSAWYSPAGRFVAFDLTGYLGCAISEDFELACWGQHAEHLGPLKLCEYIPD